MLRPDLCRHLLILRLLSNQLSSMLQLFRAILNLPVFASKLWQRACFHALERVLGIIVDHQGEHLLIDQLLGLRCVLIVVDGDGEGLLSDECGSGESFAHHTAHA